LKQAFDKTGLGAIKDIDVILPEIAKLPGASTVIEAIGKVPQVD